MTLVNLYTSAIDSTHETPAWHLLSPAGTRFVREHERPYPHHSHHIWRCNHCAHHFEDQTFQEDVVTHVKRVYVGFLFLIDQVLNVLGSLATASENQ